MNSWAQVFYSLNSKETAIRSLKKFLPEFQRCNNFKYDIEVLHDYLFSLTDEKQLHCFIGSNFLNVNYRV